MRHKYDLSFPDVELIIKLKLSSSVQENADYLNGVIFPLRTLYGGCYIKPVNRYDSMYSLEYVDKNRIVTQFYRNNDLLWRGIMTRVYSYANRNPNSYYVEKYFDMQILVDEAPGSVIMQG